MYSYWLLSFQRFNPSPNLTAELVPALGQRQLHLASRHREGEAKSESLVKIGIYRVIVPVAYFLQAVTFKYFRIQLLNILCWSFKEKVLEFLEYKSLFVNPFAKW